MMKFLGVLVLIAAAAPFASAGLGFPIGLPFPIPMPTDNTCNIPKNAADCVTGTVTSLNALTGLDPAFKSLVTSLVTTLNTLAQNINDLQNEKVKDVGSAAAQTLNKTLNDLFGIIGNILKQVLKPTSTPFDTIKQLLSLLANLVQCLVKNLGCVLNDAVSGILNIVNPLLTALQPTLAFVSALPPTIGTLLQPIIDALNNVLAQGKCSASDALTCVNDIITGVGAITANDPALKTVIGKLSDTLKTLQTTVTSLVSGSNNGKIMKTLASNVDTLLGNVVDLVQYVLDHLTKDPKIGVPTVKSIFVLLAGIPDCLLSSLNCFLDGPITSVLHTINLLFGSINKVLDKVSTIPAALNDLLNAVISALGKFVRTVGGK